MTADDSRDGLITRRSQVQILPSQLRETPDQPGFSHFTPPLIAPDRRDGSYRYELTLVDPTVLRPSVGSDRTVRGDVVSGLYPVVCLLYTSPSPRDGLLSRMPS